MIWTVINKLHADYPVHPHVFLRVLITPPQPVHFNHAHVWSSNGKIFNLSFLWVLILIWQRLAVCAFLYIIYIGFSYTMHNICSTRHISAVLLLREDVGCPYKSVERFVYSMHHHDWKCHKSRLRCNGAWRALSHDCVWTDRFERARVRYVSLRLDTLLHTPWRPHTALHAAASRISSIFTYFSLSLSLSLSHTFDWWYRTVRCGDGRSGLLFQLLIIRQRHDVLFYCLQLQCWICCIEWSCTMQLNRISRNVESESNKNKPEDRFHKRS